MADDDARTLVRRYMVLYRVEGRCAAVASSDSRFGAGLALDCSPSANVAAANAPLAILAADVNNAEKPLGSCTESNGADLARSFIF